MLWLTHLELNVMALQQQPRKTILSSSCKHLWTSSLPGTCDCRACCKIHVILEEAACLSHASHTLTGSSAHTRNWLNTRLTYLLIYHVDVGSSQQKFWGRIQQPTPSTTSLNILLLSQQTLAA